MNTEDRAKQLIRGLESDRLNAGCPSCRGNFRLQDAELFYGDDFTQEAGKIHQRQLLELHVRRHELAEQRRHMRLASERLAEAVNIGFILERLAPTAKGFGFNAIDCRPLGEPIDYVIFDGLAGKRRIERVVFAEVKTGTARLTEGQKQIRNAVETKNVVLRTYPSGGSDEN